MEKIGRKYWKTESYVYVKHNDNFYHRKSEKQYMDDQIISDYIQWSTVDNPTKTLHFFTQKMWSDESMTLNENQPVPQLELEYREMKKLQSDREITLRNDNQTQVYNSQDVSGETKNVDDEYSRIQKGIEEMEVYDVVKDSLIRALGKLKNRRRM